MVRVSILYPSRRGTFVPHAQTLQGDIANYTDVEPVIQFNEVLISKQAGDKG